MISAPVTLPLMSSTMATGDSATAAVVMPVSARSAAAMARVMVRSYGSGGVVYHIIRRNVQCLRRKNALQGSSRPSDVPIIVARGRSGDSGDSLLALQSDLFCDASRYSGSRSLYDGHHRDRDPTAM